MNILAIETSCDETALAFLKARGGIINPSFEIIQNVISSQIAVHRPFGGVVPDLAKREHVKNLPITYDAVFESFGGSKPRIDAVCVTIGPGLEPALWTGIEFAKTCYKKLKKNNLKLRLIGVNHLLGHLYSFLLSEHRDLKHLFPAIALIVSGGHTILLKMDSMTTWKKLGETRDDAVGEAFDKVAKMLGLPYPGGPEIQKLAEKGNPGAIEFPRPMIHSKDYSFSYSGLKTSVLYHLRDHKETRKEDIAASFQEAALDVLVKKTERAAKEYKARSILLSGGVAANKVLRDKLTGLSKELRVFFVAPPMKFNTDNAAMIGVAGYISLAQKKYPRASKARGNMGV